MRHEVLSWFCRNAGGRALIGGDLNTSSPLATGESGPLTWMGGPTEGGERLVYRKPARFDKVIRTAELSVRNSFAPLDDAGEGDAQPAPEETDDVEVYHAFLQLSSIGQEVRLTTTLDRPYAVQDATATVLEIHFADDDDASHSANSAESEIVVHKLPVACLIEPRRIPQPSGGRGRRRVEAGGQAGSRRVRS